MRKRALALLAAPALAAAFAGTAARSWADGAIAMGTTGNVVRDGIAFGMVVDEPKEKAADIAVSRCRTFHARAAAERCKVVATFSRQCFAVAYDPQPGTPGAGWGVGADQVAANRKALSMCEETAGPARRGYCQVEVGGCDTTGEQESSQSDTPEPAKTDAKPDQGATAPVPSPATATPALPAPVPAQENGRNASPGTRSPVFLVGVMATVGIAYAAGQLARGRAKEGFGERQVVVAGMLAVLSGAIATLLDLAGLEQAVVMVIAGVAAVAAALFA